MGCFWLKLRFSFAISTFLDIVFCRSIQAGFCKIVKQCSSLALHYELNNQMLSDYDSSRLPEVVWICNVIKALNRLESICSYCLICVFSHFLQWHDGTIAHLPFNFSPVYALLKSVCAVLFSYADQAFMCKCRIFVKEGILCTVNHVWASKTFFFF